MCGVCTCVCLCACVFVDFQRFLSQVSEVLFPKSVTTLKKFKIDEANVCLSVCLSVSVCVSHASDSSETIEVIIIIKLAIISTTKQAKSTKLTTNVGHFLGDLDFENVQLDHLFFSTTRATGDTKALSIAYGAIALA